MKEEIIKYIEEFDTEHEYGFNPKEKAMVFEHFKDCDFNVDKYNDAMMGNTCMINSRKEIITYPIDLIHGMVCALENRDLYSHEFD
tara:strand:+ start:856 stop:1113 length:258 start_codon:yes stop_codon:yes gene_type:complete